MTSPDTFDLLIVGAGPAGLSAALAAAATGVSIAIVDDNPRSGGQIWRHGPAFPASGRARDTLDRLKTCKNITWFGNTRVVQVLPDNRLAAENGRNSLLIRYDRLILATGSRERFIPFPGWTLPGVTGAGGLQALVKGGLPVTGKRVVLAGSGPLLWASAMTAKAQGAHVAAIVEQAPFSKVSGFTGKLMRTPAKLLQALHMRSVLWNTPYWCSSHVSEAHGDTGLAAITIRRGSKDIRLDCDYLGCAFGLQPNTELAATLGCRIGSSDEVAVIDVDEWQQTSAKNIFAAGECTGIGGMELSAVEGRIAAHAALDDRDAAARLFAERSRYRRFAGAMHAAFKLKPELHRLPKPDTVFCRCEDVTYAEIAAHSSWRSAKLQTRCGMGPCQGRICGDAASLLFGWRKGEGRPPLSPTRIETLLQADIHHMEKLT